MAKVPVEEIRQLIRTVGLAPYQSEELTGTVTDDLF